MTVSERFEQAFIRCLEDGIHPGPAAINDRMGRGKINHLNGRECKQRLRLMYGFGIPYIRGRFRGQIPDIHNITNELEGVSPGFRSHELSNSP